MIMTTIFKKSVLTLSITAILVAGAFLLTPILVDADVITKKQTCPSGKVVTGIDTKGNIICSPGVPATYVSGDNTSNLASQPGGASATSTANCDPGDKVISIGARAHAQSLNGGTMAAEAYADAPNLSEPQGWTAAWAIALNENTITPAIAMAITAFCADTALPPHI